MEKQQSSPNYTYIAKVMYRPMIILTRKSSISKESIRRSPKKGQISPERILEKHNFNVFNLKLDVRTHNPEIEDKRLRLTDSEDMYLD